MRGRDALPRTRTLTLDPNPIPIPIPNPIPNPIPVPIPIPSPNQVEVPCPANCSDRGVCMHGKCHCAPGYLGANCSQVAECPNACSDQGICINGACACVSGYAGDDCAATLPCPGGEGPRQVRVRLRARVRARVRVRARLDPNPKPKPNPRQCGGRGLCHRAKCFCEPGFAGADCSQALPCPSDCKDAQGVARGQCVHGACWCDPGYTGKTCAASARDNELDPHPAMAAGGRFGAPEDARACVTGVTCSAVVLDWEKAAEFKDQHGALPAAPR